MMRWLSEDLAIEGVYEALTYLDDHASVSIDDGEFVENITGIEDPLPVLTHLHSLGLVIRSGSTSTLTTAGIRAGLLLRALNGADTGEVFRRLRQLDGSLDNYSLVREGMTTGFFRSLAANPDVGSLYVCSPWINLSENERRCLATAVLRRKRRGVDPEIYVITRPDDGYGTTQANLQPFLDVSAKVFLNPKLHAKLYIREPAASGGYNMAVIGSQNLTRSKYLELGIKIESDTLILKKLIAYFFDISHYSTELRSGV